MISSINLTLARDEAGTQEINRTYITPIYSNQLGTRPNSTRGEMIQTQANMNPTVSQMSIPNHPQIEEPLPLPQILVREEIIDEASKELHTRRSGTYMDTPSRTSSHSLTGNELALLGPNTEKRILVQKRKGKHGGDNKWEHISNI